MVSMAFEIKFFIRPRVVDDDGVFKWGLIRLGDLSERFLSTLHDWRVANYKRQWKEAITALVDGAEKGALVTDFSNPDKGGIITWWPMYRDGTKVFVQNQLLFPWVAPKPFSLEKAITNIGPFETTSEDSGHPISTWQVSIKDLETFASTY